MDTFTRPVPRSKNLAGRSALVTGASGGCGHAIAHYLGTLPLKLTYRKTAAAGANVCVHYNSIEPTNLVKELGTYNVSVHSIQVDLSSAAECERLAAEAAQWSPTGGIDILVSNAGAGKRKDWIDVVPVG
jgi:NAD(P)-dependent dehydrogenase (short-subunit alcohol dehydrogenase family)